MDLIEEQWEFGSLLTRVKTEAVVDGAYLSSCHPEVAGDGSIVL